MCLDAGETQPLPGRGWEGKPVAFCTSSRCTSRRAPSRTNRAVLPKSIAGAETAARHGGQHLLLVIDRAALVCDHVRRVMRRDHERVDVSGGDRECEVVPDEPAADGAR